METVKTSRRAFLKLAGLTAAGATLAACAPVPLIGQSSTVMPCGAQRSRISCLTSRAMVLASITMAPLRAPATMPSLPKKAASHALLLGNEVIITLHLPATSAPEAAGSPPRAANVARAFLSGSNPITPNFAASKCLANEPPIMPSPTCPTMVGFFI